MTRAHFSKLARITSRGLRVRTTATIPASRSLLSHRAPLLASLTPGSSLARFTTSAQLPQPLTPDVLKTAKPAEVTDSEYHQLADEYLDGILHKFEELQDSKGEIDVEYSSGVMNVKFPHGVYVINKQPPNKQIWLSSPLSGPKRYDYVVVSEDQSSKQDTATGGWVYLRDGTFLTELLYEETGVDLHITEDISEV